MQNMNKWSQNKWSYSDLNQVLHFVLEIKRIKSFSAKIILPSKISSTQNHQHVKMFIQYYRWRYYIKCCSRAIIASSHLLNHKKTSLYTEWINAILQASRVMQWYFWRDDGVSSVVILFRETKGRARQRRWAGAQHGTRVHVGHAKKELPHLIKSRPCRYYRDIRFFLNDWYTSLLQMHLHVKKQPLTGETGRRHRPDDPHWLRNQSPHFSLWCLEQTLKFNVSFIYLIDISIPLESGFPLSLGSRASLFLSHIS